MYKKLKIIPVNLLAEYRQQVSAGLQPAFEGLKDAEISTDTFSFYTSVSAITSSRIEGEQMEVDSYLKHKMLNIEYQPNLVQKPDDLYQAYIFAQQNQLTVTCFFAAHQLIAAHLLPQSKRGAFRTGNMVVMEHATGRIQFEAAPASQVSTLFNLLWEDIEQLKTQELSHAEVFYFASFIHMVFVNIHPFDDGNGRAARLLEKWFIAQKLGPKAWYLQSELNYYTNVNQYYKNLNSLGIFYKQLDYQKAMPFLLMLPKALAV
ncbi:Fic family protein [Mucilaginibacter sp. FT3.2]|uniref:Fic family protein n=1 Tax=Mucilaginibacter sp. FT3.2 TaxID=2723090 RepID=UPI0016109AA2|nr:Fic family protein [Mucilaginibacter sp. FT3.2]MBB6230587.1 Fic family protein [Mucilaginibacter sp. FT3.2]